MIVGLDKEMDADSDENDTFDEENEDEKATRTSCRQSFGS